MTRGCVPHNDKTEETFATFHDLEGREMCHQGAGQVQIVDKPFLIKYN